MCPTEGGSRPHPSSASATDPETTTIKVPTAPGGSRLATLSLAALGIVFGDIGTSPLYAMQTVFSIGHNEVKPTPVDVYGIISMILWSITLVVSFKYVILVMRADNDGEGGILALTHLLRDRVTNRRRLSLVIVLGMLGAALFYGDSMITPAISVMSAIEGLKVVNPSFEHLVLPLSVVILSALFVVQRWGTAAVGRAFGPVMILWFLVLGVLGVPHIVAHPGILRAISPTYAIAFVVEHPMIAFVAMGAVVLTITGAEAVYADMGHFGPRPIKLSWFAIVFPALSLNYLGQAAMILEDPSTINNPFFNMAPGWATLPLVALATVATVIASQAVISGAFSVSRQAVRLGLLPRLLVKHTSKEEGGQIFVPVINWILYLGVLALIAIFGSSANLASAYGLAVTGTLILTSLLFLALARMSWHVPVWKILVFAILVGGLELAFLLANLAKVISGGWLPLLIASVVILLMSTWRRGAAVVNKRRTELEGPLDEFIEAVRNSELPRIPGVAVFPHPNSTSTPLALRSVVLFTHAMFETVVLVQIINENVPHIRHVDRVEVQDLGDPADGIVHVGVHVGFNDSQDIPKGLALAVGKTPELEFDPERARYFLSVLTLHSTGDSRLQPWRKRLFVLMANNAASRTEVFHLPPDRTVVMGAELEL